MEVFVRQLKVLWNSERMLGELKLKVLTHKVLLSATAALFGLFALGMLNLAAFFYFSPKFGMAGSALLVAVVNLAIMGILLIIANRTAPGPEAQIINEVRDMALAEIEAEAQTVQAELRLVRDEIMGLRASVSRAISNPLEALAPKVLVPLIGAIIQMLKSDSGKTGSSSGKSSRKSDS